MHYIFLGVAGFFIAAAMDVASLKRLPWVKPLAGLAAVGMVFPAMALVTMSEPRIELPMWAGYLGWVLLVVSGGLCLYSWFGNLPFKKTYMESGTSGVLIKTGTYAMTRHPGVVWYTFLLVSLFLVSGSKLMLIAGPIWLVMDIIHVYVQDRFLFGKMFPGYEDYRRETPMLIPTLRSIEACLRTIRKTGLEVR